jgi:hypothetical protein
MIPNMYAIKTYFLINLMMLIWYHKYLELFNINLRLLYKDYLDVQA